MADSGKIGWARYVGWARAALAALILAAAWLFIAEPSQWAGVLLAIYLVYALALALRGRAPSGVLGLLGLFADTVYLLVVAWYGGEPLLWLSSIFYLFVLVEGVAFSGPVEVAVMAGVSAAFCAVLPNPALHSLERTVVVAGTLAAWVAVCMRRSNASVQKLIAELNESRVAADKAREQERQRIASDFHDGPLQNFISLQMRLEILRKLLERDTQAGMEELRQCQELAQLEVRDLRLFLHSVRPMEVDGSSLVATARRTAESFQKESGIPVTFIGTTSPLGLSQETVSEVLLMVREALHNVQKHAGATRVAVQMEKTDGGLEISVEDNGHGFNFAGEYSLEELELLRLGPASLKRRARSLNAEMQLESRPGRGAGLKVRVPLQ